MLRSAPALAASLLLSTPALAGLDLDFQDGVAGWRVVLDGVMGGRSSGRVSPSDAGSLVFVGDLSLENNGGFSQIRTSVDEGELGGAEGVEMRVRGDGRTYDFDVRCSNVRMMAGAFQASFETEAGTWQTVRIPFDAFTLYSFGRQVANAPALEPVRIESVGVTLADKNPGPFRLEISSIRTYDASATPRDAGNGNDLASVAQRAGLTTLLQLADVADIADALPADERLTVFAPTNEAFAALPPELVESLLRAEGRDQLRLILAHHVTTPALPSAALLDRRAVSTLSGQRLSIDVGSGVTIGDATVVTTDVPFDGGVIHVVDRVLVPETRSATAVLAADERLATLVAAVQAAGLAAQFGPENDGPWTILAPTNEAFAALPAGTVEALLEPANREQLASILAAHVIPGRLSRTDLLAARTARSLGSTPLAFELAGGRLTVNGAGIVDADIAASNGVVHVIDRVILPDADTAPRSAEATASFDEAVALLEAAVERGAPLFNDGNHAACAAAYEMTIAALVDLTPERLGPALTQRLTMALAEGAAETRDDQRAWIYRRAMDEAFTALVARSSQNVARAH